MEPIDIKATRSLPSIRFEPDKKILRICGESYPENSFDFYAPVISWLKASLQELTELTLDIAITYMNSSSTKCTLDIMDIMEDAFGRGSKISIIWRYDRENPRSYEMAEDFREEVTFPFEIEALET
jgi:hypothetical protein